jgi:predicted amidohydrolase YtcJ
MSITIAPSRSRHPWRAGGSPLAATLLLLTACAPRPTADLVVHNARILTLDDAASIGSVLVVSEGRVVEVGGDELAASYEATEIVDAGGRSLMPGFIDSHIHVSGNPRRYVELGGVSSIAGIRELVAARADELGTGEWVTGYGWSEDELAEGRKPTRHDLDQAAPGNPTVLTRAGGHSAVASSLALAAAGLDRESPDPPSGLLERGDDGELTGVIRERQDLVTRLVPDATDEELSESLVDNLQDLFHHGITSIVLASAGFDDIERWRGIYQRPELDLPRAALQLRWPGAERLAASGLTPREGDERLRLGAIKVFVDGGFTGPAAYTRQPYKGETEYRGSLTRPAEELRQIVTQAHDAGWQLGMHAIGDAAIEMSVDWLVEALGADPRPNARHYLNHFTMRPPPRTMELMAQHGIAITQQPNFTYTLEGRYVANLEGERLQHNNPLRSPLEHGVHLALSSDILPIGPQVGLYAAVTRKGRSGATYGVDERLTIEEALRGYTTRGAWLTFEEDIKGTLDAGKLADFVILGRDPLSMHDEDLLGLEVHETWLGGRRVFRRPDPDR